MKKLMIAAAAAAMIGGAYADACSPVTPSTDCAAVYKFTMTLKTTKGYVGSESVGSICAPSVACTVIRLKDSTKFEGWIYECVCGCETIKSGTVVAWDSKRKVQMAEPAFTWTFLNVMGKSQKDAEALWAFTSGDLAYDGSRSQSYALQGAGYGVYSPSKAVFTSLSGNVTGSATASFDLTSTKKITDLACLCDPSQVWLCTDLATLVDSDTVAYGTWTMKYDSGASSKYLKNGYLKVPSYVAYTVQ